MSIAYREVAPPASLRRHLQCLWWLSDPAPDPQPQVIYPDGCCELIVHLGVPMARRDAAGVWQPQARCLFAAQQTAAIVLRASGPLACIGVRLQPAASAAVVGDRLVELRDRIVDLAALDAAFAAQLFDAAHARSGEDEAARLFALLSATLAKSPIDDRIVSAAAALQADAGGARIATLASTAGLPLRSFQDRFLRTVGLSAKAFARLQRLQAAIRLLDSGADAPALADVALGAGFSDQPHATRELRRLTGLTPARLVSALRSARESEATIALAAAFVRGGTRAG
jgi:AraC-like DNA-binding protein